MDRQSLILIIVGIVSAVAAFPVLVQMAKNVWEFFSDKLSSKKNLSIRTMGGVSRRGISHVMVKTALVGEGDVIVDEVVIQSRLTYRGGREGALAWLQLGIGYLLDDVEGLNNVLGKSFPYIGLMAVPLHRINNSYIRKPLSAIWGIVILYYFIIFVILFPIFWPVLSAGPYEELRLFSGDGEVRLLEEDSEVELKRPFILRPGFEKFFTISYPQSSLYFGRLFGRKLFLKDAKMSYVKECPKSRTIKLPRSNEFTWKVADIFKVRLRGKMRRYSVKFEDSYANIHL